MKYMWFCFLSSVIVKKMNMITETVMKTLHMPIWHPLEIECEKDDDCPVSYACCHDAFFPLKNTFCCSHYKKKETELKYAYAYAYINGNNQ